MGGNRIRLNHPPRAGVDVSGHSRLRRWHRRGRFCDEGDRGLRPYIVQPAKGNAGRPANLPDLCFQRRISRMDWMETAAWPSPARSRRQPYAPVRQRRRAASTSASARVSPISASKWSLRPDQTGSGRRNARLGEAENALNNRRDCSIASRRGKSISGVRTGGGRKVGGLLRGLLRLDDEEHARALRPCGETS